MNRSIIAQTDLTKRVIVGSCVSDGWAQVQAKNYFMQTLILFLYKLLAAVVWPLF